jgi:hypothetical protein
LPCSLIYFCILSSFGATNRIISPLSLAAKIAGSPLYNRSPVHFSVNLINFPLIFSSLLVGDDEKINQLQEIP